MREHEFGPTLSYIRRVLGMQPSVPAQLALREQEVEILTAQLDSAHARLDAVLAACDRVDRRPGPGGERKVHTVVVRQAAAGGES